MRQLLLLIAFAFTTNSISGQTGFFALLDSLLLQKQIQQSTVLQSTVTIALASHPNLKLSEPAKAKIRQLAYYHLLLTSQGATNGNTYGALKIPYFWNYGAINPRDSIYLVAKNKPLRNLPPPDGFGKYQSYAPVDRTPVLFWSDITVDKPKYALHNLKFYSFGWCSEREMAFKAWLNLKGIKSTICFAGIHVWNEIELPELPGYLIKIDNTFDEFVILPVSAKTKSNANDKYLQWYNATGAGASSKIKLDALSVSSSRAQEIRAAINAFFK